MCTTTRFLGWAPGSRVPSQFPTIGGVSAAIAREGTILNPSSNASPPHSMNEDTRDFFTADLPIHYESSSGFENGPSINPSRQFATLANIATTPITSGNPIDETSCGALCGVHSCTIFPNEAA